MRHKHPGNSDTTIANVMGIGPFSKKNNKK